MFRVARNILLVNRGLYKKKKTGQRKARFDRDSGAGKDK